MTEPMPPADVLSAFGVTGELQALAGGSLVCYRAGNIVLRPSEDDTEAQWVGQALVSLQSHQLASSSYRLALPVTVTGRDGVFVYNGWTAWSFVAGEHGPTDRFKAILQVCRHLHQDLGKLDVGKPPFLAERSNRWREADFVAWDEKTLDAVSKVNQDVLSMVQGPLRELRRIIGDCGHFHAENQLIHGDLTGNVLFDPRGEEPPGVIDMTFYWRPAAYAEAIVVADALLWHGQGNELLDFYGIDDKSRLSLLARAAYWRTLTFAIDSDMAWVRAALPQVDFQRPVDFLNSHIETVT